jgi:hypothetical protein
MHRISDISKDGPEWVEESVKNECIQNSEFVYPGELIGSGLCVGEIIAGIREILFVEGDESNI